MAKQSILVGDFVRHTQHSHVNVYGEVLRKGYLSDHHWIVRFETNTIEVSEAVLEVLLPKKMKGKRNESFKLI